MTSCLLYCTSSPTERVYSKQSSGGGVCVCVEGVGAGGWGVGGGGDGWGGDLKGRVHKQILSYLS